MCVCVRERKVKIKNKKEGRKEGRRKKKERSLPHLDDESDSFRLVDDDCHVFDLLKDPGTLKDDDGEEVDAAALFSLPLADLADVEVCCE